MAAGSANLLPLTPEVVACHLVGDLDLGLYPLLADDCCHWLAADFDGPAAMLDALAYLKAARAARVPAVLEVWRSGTGAYAWIFFAVPVPAAQARRLGLGLLREAMAIRGRMSLASYDRLFPAQDVLPAGGFGNLIAAPLQGRCRRSGTTVFLALATMEPHDDQWSYLSAVDRMTPRDVTRVLGGSGGSGGGRIQPRTPPDPHPRIARLQAALGDRLMHTVLHTLRHTFPAPVAKRIKRPASTRLVRGPSPSGRTPPGAQRGRSEAVCSWHSVACADAYTQPCTNHCHRVARGRSRSQRPSPAPVERGASSCAVWTDGTHAPWDAVSGHERLPAAPRRPGTRG